MIGVSWSLSCGLDGPKPPGLRKPGLREVQVASSWQSVLSGTFFFSEEAYFKCHVSSIFLRDLVGAVTATKGR